MLTSCDIIKITSTRCWDSQNRTEKSLLLNSDISGATNVQRNYLQNELNHWISRKKKKL